MLKDIQLSSLIRYGYSGFLATGILLLVHAEVVGAAVEAAGPVLSPLLVLAGGASIYVLYRYIIGEFLLYPVMHGLELLAHRLLKSLVDTPVRYLARDLHVPFGLRRAAYTAIRREFLPEVTRKRMDLAHSELHILYITAVELAAFWVYLEWGPKEMQDIVNPTAVLLLSALVYVAAMLADMREHMYELSVIKQVSSTSDLMDFLSNRGYCTRTDAGEVV